jgi:glutamate-1-semialdehyde 2,1-aminomutase
MNHYSKSQQLFSEAQLHIPGGVNSPVRAFGSVGGTPVFMKSAKGAYMFDEDGNRYVDYIASWGPMILGHAFEPVVKALQEKVASAISFGAPTQLEIQMAELIKTMVPNVDLVRMVNSGTEACMSALRLARGYTKRNKFIKFDGCYHGHADAFLVSAGSGVATFDIKQVGGVTNAVSDDTLVCRYNDIVDVRETVAKYKNEIAAIIIEPVAGNMGCVLPKEGFLEALRTLCDEEGIVLIFDEVMTGFRLAKGGAQELFGIKADLVCYGKVIGAGLPVGAFGGSKEIMSHIAPLGKVYQAGTLSGNPLAMTAGYTLLTELNNKQEIYQELSDKTKYLADGLSNVFKAFNVPVIVNRIGSMVSVFFSEKSIHNFDDAKASNTAYFNQFFHKMLAKGIYLPPSAYESYFLNNALTYEDLDFTISCAKESVAEINS